MFYINNVSRIYSKDKLIEWDHKGHKCLAGDVRFNG